MLLVVDNSKRNIGHSDVAFLRDWIGHDTAEIEGVDGFADDTGAHQNHDGAIHILDDGSIAWGNDIFAIFGARFVDDRLCEAIDPVSAGTRIRHCW